MSSKEKESIRKQSEDGADRQIGLSTSSQEAKTNILQRHQDFVA